MRFVAPPFGERSWVRFAAVSTDIVEHEAYGLDHLWIEHKEGSGVDIQEV